MESEAIKFADRDGSTEIIIHFITIDRIPYPHEIFL